MGCISQNGCLGPKRREKEVYTDLIEQIYSESQKKQGGDKSFEKDVINIYNNIRQRIIKKGLIRKLIDHLLSHKNKINDCLSYSLRLVSQSRIIERKLAGLLVMNEITAQIYKITKVDNGDDDRTISKSASTQNKLILQQTQMKIGADLRFDLSYFRLILHLLENQKEIIELIIISINSFCAGRKQKIGCRAEVWRVLQLLLQNLQRGIQKQKISKCYLALLQLLKQGGKQQKSHEGDLSIFFKLWQKQDEKQVDSASQQNFQFTIFKILRLFINRCMTSWDSKVLFRSIFQLYDDDRNNINKVIKLQSLIINIIQQHDLHTQILRGLFLYLLEYISAVPSERQSFRGSLNEQFDLQRYPHINDRNIRLRFFETLRRWGSSGYINLDQSVTYSSSSLVAAYTSNMKGQREYIQQIVRQFFRLTEMLNFKSNYMIVNLLIDEIRWQKTQQNTRRLLINITRQVLQTRKLLQNPIPQFYNFFIPINSQFSKQTKIQLIQLMGYIIRQLDFSQVHEQQQQTVFNESISQLLYSLYQSSKTLFTQTKYKIREQQQILIRYQYINSIISFLKCLIQKSAYIYLICFLASLNQKIGGEESNKINLYFQLYLLLEGLHIVNQKHKIPDKMISINFKISPSAKLLEIKREIQTFMNQFVGVNNELLPKICSNTNKTIKNIQQFAMVDEIDYKNMQQIFHYYFKPMNKKQSHLSYSPNKGQTSRQFKRQSLNNSYYQSDKHSRNQDDTSFKDVYERIAEH